MESKDYAYKLALKDIKKLKTVKDAAEYIDHDLAETHKDLGNGFFKEGKFPEALKEYDEAIRRNPTSASLFSNRCFARTKLMDLGEALKDANKGIELDPTFIKLYVRKGNVQNMMKAYHKALSTYDEGLKIEPTNVDLQNGKNRTMMSIQMGASSDSGQDSERMQQAMNDPEIQQLIKDPRIQQVLKDFQENPTHAQKAMSDPFISSAINKLIAAGVLKTG